MNMSNVWLHPASVSRDWKRPPLGPLHPQRHVLLRLRGRIIHVHDMAVQCENWIKEAVKENGPNTDIGHIYSL